MRPRGGRARIIADPPLDLMVGYERTAHDHRVGADGPHLADFVGIGVQHQHHARLPLGQQVQMLVQTADHMRTDVGAPGLGQPVQVGLRVAVAAPTVGHAEWVDAHAEVKVGNAAVAALPGKPQLIAAADRLALNNRHALQVGVETLAPVVAQHDIMTETGFIVAHGQHGAVLHSEDRCAAWRAEIDTVMAA
ncbi:MAG: hypothetical protein R2838_12515 [Caldilineaceae bacterium]